MDPDNVTNALFTDLYELTMAQAYHAEGMRDLAVFELAFRELPQGRNYIVAAGLEDVLRHLEGLRFSADNIEYLRSRGEFCKEFLNYLETFRFTGDVYAVAEGTLVFPNEPLVQVVAPIIEAQVTETFVLNQVHFGSVAASKAARVVTAARGRAVVDFGSRRAHGTDAAMKVARATYLAGGSGTSNVLAGERYGIPVFGTMAHSYIQAHDQELEAFQAFAAVFPATTLLVDTYDTIEGVRNVIELKRRIGQRFQVKAVRLDSGNMLKLSVETRKLLDEAGLRGVSILASSGLDEYRIEQLIREQAPIDAFGVGTKMAVSEDAPDLDMAYKLVEYAGKGRMKLSSKKVLYPGRKQVFRFMEKDVMAGDVIARFDERLPGEALLQPVMRQGRTIARLDLEQSRKRCEQQMRQLPEQFRRLEQAACPYSVQFSANLCADFARLREKIGAVLAR
jgi:nicotinate phosphoribosyltransferase